MGNRAVITTLENYNNNGVGVYLHWNGGRDSVEAFLEYMKLKGHRPPDEDCYGWARLCQVIGNFFGGTTSIGIDTVNHLYTNNYDNGTYIIRGWDIVDRKDFNGTEQNQYLMSDMLKTIDERQPKDEQLGADFLEAEVVRTKELEVGDEIFMDDGSGHVFRYTILGFGNGSINGEDVTGVPYVCYCSEGNPASNINNYLRERYYRLAHSFDLNDLNSLLGIDGDTNG